MTGGDGPDARANDMARGHAILTEHRVETSELGALAKLPPFRPVVISLMRLFDREFVSTDEIGQLVESDPSLAAELLAVVNSPLFACPSRVTSVSQAVGLLGFESTKSLATTLGMRSMMREAPRTPVVRRFWVHSIATAIIAQQFARSFHVDPHAAHVTALLHDLGRLGLLAAHPDEYAALALSAYESSDEILAAEQAGFGMTHCRAGALLAGAWNLPDPLEQVTTHHHEGASENELVALVQLCCRLADDFLFQAILRRDVHKPEQTIAQYAPALLQEELAARLEETSAAVITAIQALDF